MASRYNLLEYDSDEEQEKFPEVPLENLTSAALSSQTSWSELELHMASWAGSLSDY